MYIVRHSERLDTVNKQMFKKTNRYIENKYDPPLTVNGKKIAYDKFEQILKEKTLKIEYIYSSPFTRCIQTSLNFQKRIMDKYNILIKIRIEYGLSMIADERFTQSKSTLLLDYKLNNNYIYYKYNGNLFDLKYKSILNYTYINNETTYAHSLLNRRYTISKLISLFDKNYTNIVCTHSEILNDFYALNNTDYINKNIEFGDFNWCSYIKINLSNNKLSIDKINTVLPIKNINIFELISLYYSNENFDYSFNFDISINIKNHILTCYKSHIPKYKRFIFNKSTRVNLITDKTTNYISILDTFNNKESDLFIDMNNRDIFNDYIQLLEFVFNH
jgi:hypothetical protein